MTELHASILTVVGFFVLTLLLYILKEYIEREPSAIKSIALIRNGKLVEG